MSKPFTKTEGNAIKRILGNGYGKQIQEYLSEQGILNSKDSPHSIEYIYQIVNGQKSSESIQEAVLNLIEARNLQLKAAEEKRKRLLQ